MAAVLRRSPDPGRGLVGRQVRERLYLIVIGAVILVDTALIAWAVYLVRA